MRGKFCHAKQELHHSEFYMIASKHLDLSEIYLRTLNNNEKENSLHRKNHKSLRQA